MLSPENAQHIVDEMKAAIRCDINIMDENGMILASTNPARRGTVHAGARQIIENRLESLTIWEDDVPKTYIKVWNEETEEFEYILDEEIPLANREPELETPATGDARLTGLWLLVNVLSLTGLAAVYFLKIHKKKRG